jgi:hypothetical protein
VPNDDWLVINLGQRDVREKYIEKIKRVIMRVTGTNFQAWELGRY